MKNNEKDEVMSRFVQGELDILIATSVVEVGIDVPNATVMMIEGAERFGLAQLPSFPAAEVGSLPMRGSEATSML